MMQSMTAALCAARDPQSPTKPDPAKLSRTFFCARQEKSWEKKWVACFPRHTKLCAANGLPFFYLVAHTQHYIVSSRMEDGRKAKDDSFFPFSFIHFCRQRLSKWPFDTVNKNQGNSLIFLFWLPINSWFLPKFTTFNRWLLVLNFAQFLLKWDYFGFWPTVLLFLLPILLAFEIRVSMWTNQFFLGGYYVYKRHHSSLYLIIITAKQWEH